MGLIVYKEYKNFLNREEFLECWSYLKKWEYIGETGAKEFNEVKFWCIWLNDIEFFTKYLFNKIQSVTEDKLRLERVYANGQTYGLPGALHQDSLDSAGKTFLYYPTGIWETDWGGGTAFNQNGVTTIYPYTPNAAIYFSGNIPHCGLEPTRYSQQLRTTIAFKMTKV